MSVWRKLVETFAKPKQPVRKSDDRYHRLLLLQKRHAFIDVNFNRLGKTYRSIILSLHPEEGYIRIDELFPRDGTQHLLEGDIADIKSTSKDIAVSFTSRFLAKRMEQGSPVYLMELPEELSVSHNRQAFRISVHGEAGLNIDMSDHNGEPLDGDIVNMSAEGIKLNIDGDCVKVLERHPVIEDVVITLPSDVDIECTIEIRNVYFMRTPHEHTLAGGKLLVPNPQQQVKLAQYLAGVQRKQLRREMRF